MKLTLLTATHLRRALPMSEAVEAMKEAFAELSTGRAIAPQRLVLPVEPAGGTTLMKPALTRSGLGAKLVSVFPGNR
ncbi:MAG: ornithine cyclodeaminase family protein, partial [Thermoanaerobaculia bacterium]